MSTLSQVRPHPEVVDTEIDEGEIALLHLGSKTYFSLNLTGARVWQYLKQGLNLCDISLRIQEEFDVEPAHAHWCVRQLVDQLLHNELAQRL